jgi:KDO2-lipid IV(A) lauroyltransferase
VSAPKPPLWQDLVWRLEAAAFAGFTLVNRALPLEWVSGFGGWLLRTFGPLTRYHDVAERNIRIVFPDMAPAERRRLLAAQWDNLGRTFAEFPQEDRITPASGRVEMVGGERLEEIARSGEPVVFISGHFANFEVMSAAILHYGVPCQITYRAANNPYIERQFRESRARYGVKLFAPKGGDGARELLEGLKRGESAALMNDQKFNQGLPIPFFGRPAWTAPGPARMALRFGCVLQPLSVRRLKGATFRVVVHAPIELEKTGDRARDIEAGVRRVSAFIEDRVREHPDDWFWVHRRWPREVYAASDLDGLRSSERSKGPS